MDRRLLFLINHEWTSPGLDWFMAAVSSIGALAPLLVVAGVAVLVFGGFRGRAFLGCAAVVFLINDGLVTQIMKDAIGRPRPYEALRGVRVVDLKSTKPRLLGLFQPAVVDESRFPLSPPRGRSYPSGHISNNFAMAVLLSVFYPPWGVLYFGVAALVSYSRIYVGAHWPSDTIGSAAQGAGIALLGIALCELMWRRLGHRWLAGLHSKYPTLLPHIS